ncbi:MAG: sigma-54-dependent transcriptional regulator [Thermodesulfobacteriota bacterium]
MGNNEVNFRRNTILIVDDEDGAREALELLLEDEYKVLSANSGHKAIGVFGSESVDLVLLDISMPNMDGIETLSKLKELDGDIDVIMVSAINNAPKAVEAMRLGAYDYITKPFETEDILLSIKRVLDKQHLKREVEFLRNEVESQKGPWDLITQNKKMLDIKKVIQRVAKTNSSVLIYGESGTGKEIIARSIHYYSDRKNAPFVAVNCGAIPSELIESELFGHEKGAFTGADKKRLGKFEYADGGTLFLDEVSTFPSHLQVKLLRVLQEHMIERVGGNNSIKVDVKIIAASNVRLQDEVEKGKFRKDLYFRLNVVPITLPSLRERKGDIPILANHFLKRFNKRFNKNIKGFSEQFMDVLKRYDWPGNIRELENIVERLVVLSADDDLLSLTDLPVEVFATNNLKKVTAKTSNFKEACHIFERQFILDALKRANWHQTKTAQMMGIHRNTLIEKMRLLNIKIKED